MNRKLLKFLLFSLGMATSVAAAFSSIILLIFNMFGMYSIVYEPNMTLAIVEIIMLTIAAATCLAATEIYYEYLSSEK